MSLLAWFRDRFQKDAAHFLYHRISAKRVSLEHGEPQDKEFEHGKHYFRLWLVEMFLKDDRRWFSNWHPAVHSAVEFEMGDEATVVTRIAGPTQIKGLDKDHLDKFITYNRALTKLVPFNGGTVSLSAGLLAMEGEKDVDKLIASLGEFSTLLSVSQLSTVLNVAKPLAGVLGNLVGAIDGKLELGLDQTYGGTGGDNALRSGYIAVIRATKDDLDAEKLTVKNDELRYDGEHLSGYHYLLFRIECLDERDDWDSLPAIQEPLERAMRALETQNKEEAAVHLRTAITNAHRSKDLTKKVDRRRVVEMLRERYKELEEDLGLGAFSKADRKLSTLMSNAMDVRQAANLGEMSVEEALKDL